MRGIVLIVFVGTLGCGPSILLEGDDTTAGDVDGTTGSSSTPVSTTSVPPNSSTTTSPPSPGSSTVTSVSTSADTGSDDFPSDDECGCAFLCDPCYDPCTGEPMPDCPADVECDVWAQDCPDGEKCMPWSNDGGLQWNATRCSPIDAMPALPGDVCLVEGSGLSGIDNCALGAMCWDVDPDTNFGTCVPMCTGFADTPVCEVGSACLVANDGVIALCLPTCDPLLGDCADGSGCFPTTDTSDGALVCLPAPSPHLDTPATCAHLGGCDVGQVCVGPDRLLDCVQEDGCCTAWCDLDNPVCPDGLTCEAYFESGGEPLGVCVG